MIVGNPEIEMPHSRHSSRIDTSELKTQIIRNLGHQTVEIYFHHLKLLFSLKLSKSEFDKICISMIGKENVSLHNQLIGSIIKNACLAKTPPAKGSMLEGSLNVKISNVYQSSHQSLSGDIFLPSPHKGRSWNLQNVLSEEPPPWTQEQQSVAELISLGSRPPLEVVSVEDEEEVEQRAGSLSIQSRSLIKAPIGIPMNMGGARKALSNGCISGFHPDTCHKICELSDTRSLRNRLERKLEMEGLGISLDCINLSNNGLDAFLKRLIKPCMELAKSRSGHDYLKQVNDQLIPGLNVMWPERYMQRSTQSVSASLLDFLVAMELNPQILGEDWPIQLEKVCLHASE